ncbi:hypothetical protein [Actinacidiphila paucisporea]|uniref:hypothetical protein n=1 Tax=Actinacidiphila paucisporea TaxID=310782 RepID=UPI002244FA05|nr:hypothetical protein [Actinacidiphila paucisporea]
MDIDVSVDLIHHRGRRPAAGVPGDQRVAVGGIENRGRERVPEGMGFHDHESGALPGPAEHPPGPDQRPRLSGMLVSTRRCNSTSSATVDPHSSTSTLEALSGFS